MSLFWYDKFGDKLKIRNIITCSWQCQAIKLQTKNIAIFFHSGKLGDLPNHFLFFSIN